MTTAVTSACRTREIPRSEELTYAAARGFACFACGKTLTNGIEVGRAVGKLGVHDIGATVWACP